MKTAKVNLLGSINLYHIGQDVPSKGLHFYTLSFGKIDYRPTRVTLAAESVPGLHFFNMKNGVMKYYKDNVESNDVVISTGLLFYRLENGVIKYYHNQKAQEEEASIGLHYFYRTLGFKHNQFQITPIQGPIRPGGGGSIGRGKDPHFERHKHRVIGDQDLFDIIFILIKAGII